ncbi:uncharacterized protein LOC111077769 [Drosophila obscura]|uniref:uncharacterized protein LOC111077769 n=1 Tax=Drosophila obscura TaxID=7282 RepID=UPI000BA06E40|nr:uncharacterized protein LOC111077769 [Drosophila obscura]
MDPNRKKGQGAMRARDFRRAFMQSVSTRMELSRAHAMQQELLLAMMPGRGGRGGRRGRGHGRGRGGRRAPYVPQELVPQNLVPQNLVPQDLVPQNLVPQDRRKSISSI